MRSILAFFYIIGFAAALHAGDSPRAPECEPWEPGRSDGNVCTSFTPDPLRLNGAALYSPGRKPWVTDTDSPHPEGVGAGPFGAEATGRLTQGFRLGLYKAAPLGRREIQPIRGFQIQLDEDRSSNCADSPARHEFRAVHMGTEWRIVLYAPDKPTAEKASKAAFARVAELEMVMSDYNPKSELMKLCAANDGDPGKPIHLSSDLFDVLKKADAVSSASDGAFDITVGPLVKLWRVARKVKEKPAAQDLAAAKELVGYKLMAIDAKASTVTLAKAKMRLDLGGIGKGYAADKALEVLKEQGCPRALIAASGDITVGDAPPGKDRWEVEIASITEDRPTRKLKLANQSVSTSGDLFQHVEIDGIRYSHLLDPKTGLGLTGRRSATFIAPKGWQADALTKVASVMEPAKALKVIEGYPGAAMFLVAKDSDEAKETVTESVGFGKFLAVPEKK